ncbi:MAG TPA: hypothetical protein VG297_10355 [Bryobacteraceae bacterium]|jgi:hypothetical protein|nr:hypothetical protein [Bryobacteraceae bacterium]
MTIGSLGKVLASQAIESTKATVLDAVMPADPKKPEPAKSPEPRPAAAPTPDTGSAIVAQIHAMQRPLKDDQELAVLFRAGDEMLRVNEIFVPNPEVLVFAGVDSHGNVTRVITPADAAQVICKILKVPPGATASRVNVLTPRPPPKPAA